MEFFLLALYALSIYFLYQNVEADDSDFTDESDGEFPFIDAV